jgi:Tfp pilus assembly PilM family ATPase
MAVYERHTGFTLSSSKIQLVELNYKNNEFILQNVDEVYFDDNLDFINDKETKIVSVIQSSFNELLIRKPVTSGLVSFTLPLEMFFITQINYDNSLMNQDLIQELTWELSVLYPFVNPKELMVRYFEIKKNRIIDKNTVLVSAVLRRYIKMLETFCRQNNLRLRFIDNSHFASERALTSVYNTSQSLVLSVYISKKTLSLIFSLEGKPVLVKVMSFRSANEIPGIILRETTPTETVNLNRSMIDAAYITGEQITNSFVNSLSTSVKIDFIQFNPFAKITPDQILLESSFYSKKFNSFSPAAGIAYRLA